MRTHHTVIHIPVDYDVPEGGTPQQSARFMADVAALQIERLYNDTAPVVVGFPRIDPPHRNGQDAPAEAPSPIADHTNRLMRALALPEDARDTVRDALERVLAAALDSITTPAGAESDR